MTLTTPASRITSPHSSASAISCGPPNALVWLDIVAPKPKDFAVIQTEFGLHPLAIEDAVHSHQQTKIEAYGDSWVLVVHGSSRNGNALELHELAIFVGRKYVVTVKSPAPYPLDEARRRWNQPGNGLRRDSGALLYTILDTVVDGYSPVAEAFEEQVEALESALWWAGIRTNDVLLEIYKMKKNSCSLSTRRCSDTRYPRANPSVEIYNCLRAKKSHIITMSTTTSRG